MPAPPGSTWTDFPGALMTYDSTGAVIEVNDAAAAMLGASPQDVLGSLAEEADWLVTDARDGPISVHPVVAALKGRHDVRGALARVRRPDGADVWLQVDAIPDFSTSGDVSRVMAMLTDVTHLITHSRMSGRSAGDHIVDEVAERLAHARLDAEAILTTVTRSLSKLRPGIWVASLMGKDPDMMRVIAIDDADPTFARYIEAMQGSGAVSSAPISSRVIESGEPLLIPSLAADGVRDMLNDELRSYLDQHPVQIKGMPYLGIMVVPMRARGATIGTLGLFERRGSNPLTDKDIFWLQAIADRTGLAVENAQLYQDAVQRLERLSALQSVSLAISASPDLRVTLKIILDQVMVQLKTDAADVLLLDDSDNMLSFAASTGFLATAVPDYRLPLDDSLPGRTVSSRRIETVTALGAFSQFRRRSLFAREGFKAYGAVPLITRGKLLVALEVFHRSSLTPDQEWLSFLDALGSVAAIAIDNASMQERLRTAASRPGGPRTSSVGPALSPLEKQIIRLVVAGSTSARTPSSSTCARSWRRQARPTGPSWRTR